MGAGGFRYWVVEGTGSGGSCTWSPERILRCTITQAIRPVIATAINH